MRKLVTCLSSPRPSSIAPRPRQPAQRQRARVVIVSGYRLSGHQPDQREHGHRGGFDYARQRA